MKKLDSKTLLLLLVGVVLGFAIFYVMTFVYQASLPTGAPKVNIHTPEMQQYHDDYTKIASVMPDSVKQQLSGLGYIAPDQINNTGLTVFSYPKMDGSLLFLYSPSCGYCHKMYPELVDTKAKLGDKISIYPIQIKLFDQDPNVSDFNMHLAHIYGLGKERFWGTPTFVINGNLRHIGYVNSTRLIGMFNQTSL